MFLAQLCILFLAYATLLGALSSLPPRSQGPAPQAVKRSIEINRLRFSDALAQIAKSFNTVVGLEETPQPQNEKLLTLSLNQDSISDALNRFIKADPRYEWHLETDGAIRVRSVQPPPPLGDLILINFSLVNRYRREISKLLDEQSEFQNWLKERGCERVEYTTGHDWDSDTKRISFSSTGTTLRENLDQVALETGTYFWSITKLPDRAGCRVSIRI